MALVTGRNGATQSRNHAAKTINRLVERLKNLRALECLFEEYEVSSVEEVRNEAQKLARRQARARLKDRIGDRIELQIGSAFTNAVVVTVGYQFATLHANGIGEFKADLMKLVNRRFIG